MNSVVTRLPLTKASLGAGNRDDELDRSSAPAVDHPFTDGMLEVNDSTLASFSQAPQISLPQLSHNINPIDHKPTTTFVPTPIPTATTTATKPAYNCWIQHNNPIGRAASPSSLAIPAHLSSCGSLNDTSYTRNSVQSWLRENIQTTRTLSSTKTSREQGIQVNGRKRKRGASPELQEAGPTAQLTRKALNTHLASMMSSDQSSVTNVCTIHIS